MAPGSTDQSRQQLLISWIGNTDIRAMLTAQPSHVAEKIADRLGINIGGAPVIDGPVKTALNNIVFDNVILLTNYADPELSSLYRDWVGTPVEIREVVLRDPTDYGEIFRVVRTQMESIVPELPAGVTPAYLLSPGTPAMAAIWVLLGKTLFPGRFYQTWQSQVTETEIPFDISLDVVPELFKAADSRLSHLAAGSPQETPGFDRVIGDSAAIRTAVGRAHRAAIRSVSVLITGESGTGKEMFAHAIHTASPRREAPFVVVNCAAIPTHLIESEIFGHKKGAFTGAVTARDGALKRADGGTLFLDEIGELDRDLQAKFLRVLEPPVGETSSVREFLPVGSDKSERADVRVLAATNRNLNAMVTEGAFREDLLYRLAVITVKLPALRERGTDAVIIADTLMQRINDEFQREEPGYRHKIISVSAKNFVSSHRWPGNVRQLYNALLQAAVMADGDTITDQDISAALAETPVGEKPIDFEEELPLGNGFDLDNHLRSIQKAYIRRALAQAHGIKAEAARLLGLKSHQTLSAQIERLGISDE
ncbi:MAG: sigma 54-interacting transcriptional regulator [Alkalispirochaeta sp.]